MGHSICDQLFSSFLASTKTKLIIDRKTLELFSPSKKILRTASARICTWAIFLMAYYYDVVYQKGQNIRLQVQTYEDDELEATNAYSETNVATCKALYKLKAKCFVPSVSDNDRAHYCGKWSCSNKDWLSRKVHFFYLLRMTLCITVESYTPQNTDKR